MSYTTITQSTKDTALQDRVMAAGMKEAINNPTYAATPFGEQVRHSPQMALNYFLWPTATEYETEYAYALDNSNPNPGGDVGVITDANIQAVVQTHWPDQLVVEPQVPIFPTAPVPS